MATVQRREFFSSHLSSGNTQKKDETNSVKNEGERIVVAHELLRQELAESRARLEEQFKD